MARRARAPQPRRSAALEKFGWHAMVGTGRCGRCGLPAANAIHDEANRPDTVADWGLLATGELQAA
jgi:hypothetical protein